jgi:hypothetical protein
MRTVYLCQSFYTGLLDGLPFLDSLFEIHHSLATLKSL